MSLLERHWRLFVDESGTFGDVAKDVVVAGLLVRGDMSGPGAVRRALVTAAPGIAWPLHAAFLNRPVMFALCRCSAALAAEPTAPRAERIDQAVAEAGQIFVSRSPEMFRGAIARVQRGKFPEDPTLRALTRLMRTEAPGAYRTLEDQIAEVWATVRCSILKLATTGPQATAHQNQGLVGEAGQSDTSGAMIFCAGESRRGDAGEGFANRAQIDSARYLALLEILVERAVAVLSRLDGSHRLWLHVLERDVYDASRGRATRLRRQDLNGIGGRIEAAFAGKVRVAAADIAKFDTRVSALYVLADFVSNGTRWIVKSRRAALASVERGISRRYPAAVRSGVPSLPHLAASGEAARYLRGAVTHLPAAGDGIRRWAHEQAVEWATVRAAFGGST